MTKKKTDSPLSRWSQRKMLVQEGTIPSNASTELESDTDVELQATLQGEQLAQLDEKGELQQGAPPSEDEIDTEKFANIDYDALNYDSDYTQFMAKNVPEIVKRKALRALWNSDPVFANLDGLNDYDEDFTIVEPMTKAIASAWNMGKGYMTAEEEEQKNAAREKDEEEAQTASIENSDEDAPEEEQLADHDADEIAEDENSEAEAQPQELEEKIETS